MSNVTVILSEQDLGEFLEDNQDYMEAYRAELERRLTDYFGEATVEISSNALVDFIDIDGEQDELGTVAHIMGQMTEDWNWLPEGV